MNDSEKNTVKNKNPCWLCMHASTPLAESIHTRILEKIPVVQSQKLADMASEAILSNYPDAEGACRKSVFKHIRKHSMHPGIRITEYIRDMHDLTETLKTQMYHVDPESKSKTLDLSAAKTYMAAVVQISNLYRIGDTNKLTFGNK